MRRLLVALALVFPLMLSPGVQAQEPDTINPEVVYPMTQNTRGGVTIAFNTPAWDWGTRDIAKWYAKRIDHLRVYKRGTCADHPRAWCITVRVVNRPRADWWGLDYLFPGNRILYNVAPTTSNSRWLHRMVACHEFSHALGVLHHTRPGCLTDMRRYPSALELRVIKNYYESHWDPNWSANG